jgi:cysteine desulfurase / selenocysteine lyase
LLTSAAMPPVIDVDAERAATPGCTLVDHLNNAGAALPTAATLEAVVGHLRLEAERGGYEAERQVADRIAALRASVARLLGADEDEVLVTGSDTQSWTKALWGFALGGGFVAGARILVDRLSYNSHYLGLLQVRELTGAAIEVVPSTTDGTLDLDALETALGAGGVALVAATHVGTHRGLVNPVAEVGAACGRSDVPFFLDACQSVGQLPVDVGSLGCAVLTATGRKWLRGPRGTGLLYVERSFAERLRPPGISETSAAWEDVDRYSLRPGVVRFAEFEVPVAAHLGLGVAIDHALDLGLESIAARVGALGKRLRAALAATDGVEVHDGGERRGGIVTFTVAEVAPQEVADAAARAGVNISVSSSPWALLDLRAPRPEAVVRASPHYYNTDAELDRLVEVVTACAA